MGLSVAVGQFAANTATGNQTVSSITDQDGGAFTPLALLLWVTNVTANAYAQGAYFCFGCATSPTQRWTVSYADDDGLNTTDSGRSGSASLIARILNDGTPTVDAEADFVSFGSGEFTINWSNAPGSAWLVNYMALGGSDITNAKAGTVNLASSGASQAFTDPGFQPDFLLTAHQLLSPLGSSATAEVGFGAATSASDQAASVVIARDAQGTSLNGQWQKSGRVMLGMASDSAADCEAALSSFDANGFTLSVSDLPAAARTMCYLAIKGGQWKAGVDTQATTNTAKDTALPFDPVAVGFFSTNATSSASIFTTGCRMTVGAGNGVSETFSWFDSQDAQGTSDTAQKSLNTKAIGFGFTNTSSETVTGTADLSMGTEEFTLTWAGVDGNAREFIYWAAGEEPVVESAFVPRVMVL